MPDQTTFSIDELSGLTGFPVRTIRYYIQIGLLARPVGERRAAHYEASHLETLLRIRRLTENGMSLERIAKALSEKESPGRTEQTPPGTISVRTHAVIAPGIELSIDPEAARLTSHELRKLIAACMEAAKNARNPDI